MKITLNVDDSLLDRVVKSTGSKTKTAAIDYPLREIDRRTRLTEVLRRSADLIEEDLEEIFDPASDPQTLRVAEGSAAYNKKQ